MKMFITVALCCVLAGAVVMVGCNRWNEKKTSDAKGGATKTECPPDATYCPLDSGKDDITIKRMVISRDSKVMAQLAEPIEVVAYIHHPDYRKPDKVTVWLDSGTWIIPEDMNSLSRVERKRTESGMPLALAGVQ